MNKDIKEIKRLLKIKKKPQDPKPKEERCSSCNKTQKETKVLICLRHTPNFLICDECVELCEEICSTPGQFKKVGPQKPPKSSQEKNS